MGATYVINSKHADVVKEIKEVTKGGTHYGIDTTGVPIVVRQGLQALRPLGQLAIVGVTPEMNINVHEEIMAEGKTMAGVIEGDAVPQLFIPEWVEYYKKGMFPFDKLVKFYDFTQINDAFAPSHKKTVFNRTDSSDKKGPLAQPLLVIPSYRPPLLMPLGGAAGSLGPIGDSSTIVF